jgi:hypothetical protein
MMLGATHMLLNPDGVSRRDMKVEGYCDAVTSTTLHFTHCSL